MIKCKVTKNIMQDGVGIAGIKIHQIVTGIVTLIIAIITFLLLYAYVQIDLLMWLIFIEIAIAVSTGIIRIQGQSLISYFLKPGVDKRYYCSKGVYNNVRGKK